MAKIFSDFKLTSLFHRRVMRTQKFKIPIAGTQRCSSKPTVGQIIALGAFPAAWDSVFLSICLLCHSAESIPSPKQNSQCTLVTLMLPPTLFHTVGLIFNSGENHSGKKKQKNGGWGGRGREENVGWWGGGVDFTFSVCFIHSKMYGRKVKLKTKSVQSYSSTHSSLGN